MFFDFLLKNLQTKNIEKETKQKLKSIFSFFFDFSNVIESERKQKQKQKRVETKTHFEISIV